MTSNKPTLTELKALFRGQNQLFKASFIFSSLLTQTHSCWLFTQAASTTATLQLTPRRLWTSLHISTHVTTELLSHIPEGKINNLRKPSSLQSGWTVCGCWKNCGCDCYDHILHCPSSWLKTRSSSLWTWNMFFTLNENRTDWDSFFFGLSSQCKAWFIFLHWNDTEACLHSPV